VYFTTTYKQDAPAQPRGGYEYSRTQNPTRTALEQNLASLEGGRHGLCFASGLAATTALLARLVPGDHVVCGDDLYGGTYRLFSKVFERFGLRFTAVDSTDPKKVAAAIEERTRYVYVETPSNPLLRLTDLAAVAALAHARGKLVVVDNTFASPWLQRPLELGCEIVLHSLSKYVGGHSDAIGGALVLNDDALRAELAFHQNAIGGCLGPMESFLFLRGTKTLALRMQRHCENALELARHLEASQHVERVYYPGLTSHPQHALSTVQMRGPGGMIAFELEGGVEAANAFASATRIFTLAESLGGVESLVEVPASMTHASIPAAERMRAGRADGLVRLSVGIEHVDDLRRDLDDALRTALRPARAGR
jgi:cystathionine gamma-lyase